MGRVDDHAYYIAYRLMMRRSHGENIIVHVANIYMTMTLILSHIDFIYSNNLCNMIHVMKLIIAATC